MTEQTLEESGGGGGDAMVECVGMEECVPQERREEEAEGGDAKHHQVHLWEQLGGNGKGSLVETVCGCGQ